MPRVLIVDDSAMDRELAAGLLAKGKEISVELVSNGHEALDVLEKSAPDLVVTDLLMPEVDGLELVNKIKTTHPLVPVILMTSRGNEEVAVEALQSGAASYVPKRRLARSLLSTVRTVLAISGERRSHARLLECSTEMNHSFVLKTDYTLVPPLVMYVQETSTRLGLCSESDSLQVGIAMEEVLSNAVYHGNLEIDSQMREKHFTEYRALIEERSARSPYRDRCVYVDLRFQPTRAEFVVRDEGAGFDVAAITSAPDLPDVNKLSGRGLFLVRTFMDEVTFNDVGNVVTMVKWRDGKRE
jgi:CheY-like chemotaxis protein/anti-sigma regulatory factor (Ser/Thr protein kinase)